MKNLKLFFTLTVLIYCAKLFSQESIVFDKQYLFDNRNNYIKDFKQTPDGGFICGGSIGFEMFDERFLLFKTDSLGEVEWYKYQDSVSVNSDLWAVDITKTGNYVGFGVTQENPEWHSCGAIVMYNNIGETLWTKQYAFEHPSINDMFSMITFYDGLYTSDNSLVVAGAIKDDNLGSSAPNPIVVKTNLIGDTLWTWRLFNVDNKIVIESIDETIEGDYIAVGRADLPIIPEDKTYAPQRGFIVKLSSSGEQIYLKEWTDIDYNYFTDVAINSNNELVISGVYWKHPTDDNSTGHTLLVKTDSIGGTIFYKQIQYGKNVGANAIAISVTDEICVTSMYESLLGYINWKYDVLLQKFSNSGEILFTDYIGGQNTENWPYAVVSTNDNGFAFCGAYTTNSGPRSWLVKVDSLGNGVYNEGWINIINSNQMLSLINIYPNPAQEIINISFPFEYSAFNATILNLEGKEIKVFDESETNFYIGDLCNGVYLVKIIANNQMFYQKLVINH
jgi:hypothetical protein